MNVQAVNLAIAGSKDAFISLIRESEQMMYAIGKGLLKNDADIADAIQETILKSYNGIGKLRDPAYFRTWLIRILINECRQTIRQNNKYIPLSISHAQGVIDASPSERMEMEDLLAGLDLDHREVVVLYYLDDLSIKDIAQLLDLSENTVKSRLYRARAKLASLLKETEALEGLK
ncbi:RNA polymerase sigma factor [Paenibacillus sacheonensis]|uniref:Sigma-70 family RNA polymerase sigma factor n=1 Tax=Paenibacillus sacheonensis TaxID=742054 RepID=A0A7X4YPP2_9BACL|nr:sigma-70 family RNA polymerase sigma factor [Paenibacillus sacheonensis]MBM7565018.1 RNA polymerase sigma-70 factor (ECF subfamily) [Paenibacillus sacheonensis]NBC70197.1 sigma-70 family RNA polymerase sigma factor [Paenibacillus sacheonensis]